MAISFGVSDLFKKDMVALALTKSRMTDMDMISSGHRQDFYKHGADYVKALNPDNRSIAGGHDPYFMMFEILSDVHPEWEAYLWVQACLRMTLLDLANPTKVFLSAPEGSHYQAPPRS